MRAHKILVWLNPEYFGLFRIFRNISEYFGYFPSHRQRTAHLSPGTSHNTSLYLELDGMLRDDPNSSCETLKDTRGWGRGSRERRNILFHSFFKIQRMPLLLGCPWSLKYWLVSLLLSFLFSLFFIRFLQTASFSWITGFCKTKIRKYSYFPFTETTEMIYVFFFVIGIVIWIFAFKYWHVNENFTRHG